MRLRGVDSQGSVVFKDVRFTVRLPELAGLIAALVLALEFFHGVEVALVMLAYWGLQGKFPFSFDVEK